MRIEYIPDRAEDCPLIRIFGGGAHEVKTLVAAFGRLAQSHDQFVALESLPGFSSVGGTSITAKLTYRDDGVRQLGESTRFEWSLSSSAWGEVAKLAAPFVESRKSGTYQWLDARTDISILISIDGDW